MGKRRTGEVREFQHCSHFLELDLELCRCLFSLLQNGIELITGLS